MHQHFQLTNSATRITESTSSCLDLIMTQSLHIVSRTEVLPAICSDHRVPYAYIRNSVIKNKPFKRIIYNYSKLDSNKFCNLLTNVNWRNIIENDTIDLSAANFTDTFFEIAKQCMPAKTILVRQRDALWINDEIRILIEKRKKKKKNHKKAKQSNREVDWRKFRQFRNYVILKIRHRKSEFLQELDRKASDPNVFRQKDWWRLVRAFLKKKSIDNDEIPPIDYNGKIYYSNKETANIFNDFFIKQSILEHEDDTPPHLPQLDCQLNDITLSVSEVSNIIQNLDKSKATGPDQVHNRLLIVASSIIAEPLTVLVNRCLSDSKFPAIWKVSHVTPLHKKGPKEFCNNYRPISLLSCIGKVLEKCIHKHVYNFLQYNNIITQSQSGFIRGDSTVNQLLCIYNDLCSSFDKGITAQAVYLDISKAFDRVWHTGLLLKLEAVGIRGKLLNWFRKRHKLLMFHKMILGLCPQYISDLLPPLVAHINPYHRRRPLERDVTTCKTELYRNSFIPSTTAEWNSLPISVQQSTSLSVFKRSLSLSDSKVPAYYYFGERNAQVIHCRLRLEMSNLNNDLVNRHLSTDPKCSCGYSRETAEHYLLHCPNYINIRARTILTLPSNQTNIRTLLYGNLDLRLPENKHIFLTVHEFIMLSKRF